MVDTLLDVVDADGKLSLREAVEAATGNVEVNEAPAGSSTETDRIVFDPAALQMEAGEGNPLVIVLGGSELLVTDELEIVGLGRDLLTLDASGSSRIFQVRGSTFALSGMTLRGAVGSYAGMVIYSYYSELILSDLLISENSGYQGTAIYAQSGSLQLRNAEVRNNTASYSGGAFCFYGTAVTLVNVALVENTAYYGGAMYINDCSLAMRGVTMAGNVARYRSSGTGGIYESDGGKSTLTFENSIYAENGGADAVRASFFVTNSILSDGVVDFVRYRGIGADGVWGTADDVPGDYRLQPDSIGVDMGEDALLAADDLTDAAGDPRRVNVRVDIGAYEVQAPSTGLDVPSAVVTTLVDTNDFYDGETSLREALAHAALLGLNEHTVSFDSALGGQTMVLSEELRLYGNVTVLAPEGGLTLDATNQFRVASVLGRGAEVTLEGVTLTGGNSSGRGGGVWVSDGALTLRNVAVRDNQCNEYGGGISVIRGALTLEQCEVSGNSSTGYSGGGISAEESLVRVLSSRIENNTTSSGGGAIYHQSNGKDGADLQVENSLLRGNSANYNGGAIYIYRGNLLLEQCEVSDNESRGTGAIYRYFGDVVIRQSTISGNTSRDLYGAVYGEYSAGSFAIENSIIAGNTGGVDLYLPNDNPELLVSSSLIGLDPCFADAENGDYSLAAHSPAIDRGGANVTALKEDLSGAPRVVWDDVDIGAYEFQSKPLGAERPSSEVTTLEDVVDWTDGETSIRETLVYAALDGLNEGWISFDERLAGGTLALTNVLSVYGSVHLVAPEGGLTLDAQQRGRLLECPIAGSELDLMGFTLMGASISKDGGALRMLRSTLNLTDCTVCSNVVSGYNCDGAGIYALASTVTVTRCSFWDNSASSGGAAICGVSTPVTVLDSTFRGNHSGSSGGAIYTDDHLTLVDSLLEQNSNSSNGGSIYAGFLSGTNSTVRYNSASSGGGISLSSGGSSSLYRMRIYQNHATYRGGGLYLGSGNQTLSQTLICDNVADDLGGGIYKSGVNTLTLNHSTVAGNCSSGEGGGVWCWRYGALELRNAVLASNIKLPTDANDLYVPNTTNFVSSFIGAEDGVPGFVCPPTAGEDGIWASDDDTVGDYHLTADAPLHNTGEASWILEGDVDLDGYPRLRGASTDMGAYEWTHLAVKAMANQITEIGAQFELQCEAEDADLPSDNIVLRWSLGADAPAGASIVSETGLFSWMPESTGTWSVAVLVTDGSVWATNSFNLRVADEFENLPPVIQPIASVVLNENETLEFTVEAADANVIKVPVSLTLSSSNMPSGIDFDSTTGHFLWTPSEAQGPGVYPFTLTATEVRSDGIDPLSAAYDFTVQVAEVNQAPELTLPPLPASIHEGELFSFIADAADSDLPGNTLTFWLDDAPSGATIDRLTGEFSWTPSEAQGPSEQTFGVRVFDGTASRVLPVSVQVQEVNQAPVLPVLTEKTVQGTQRLLFWVGLYDPDIRAGDSVQRLTCTLSGSDVPSGASISSSGYFEWTPTALQTPGTYTFEVVGSDGELSVRRELTIQAISPPDLTVEELELPEGPLLEGQALRLRAKVANPGSGDLLQGVYVGFYIDETYRGRTWVSAESLQAGQYAWTEFIWTDAVPGTHSVEVWADYASSVLETDEGNNARTEMLPEIGVPDLCITNLVQSPAVVVGGQPVSFASVVTNLAAGTARDVAVQLKVDDQWGAQTVLRGPFEAGQGAPVLLTWTATPGEHQIELVVDRQETIAETNRINNVVGLELAEVDDTTPPVFGSVTPGAGQHVSGIFQINATASDETSVSSYAIELLGGALTEWTLLHEGAAGAFSWDTTALADGAYSLRFTATDLSGNEQELTRAVVVDNAAPDAPVLSASAQEFGVALSWSVAADAEVSSYRIYRAASASGPFNAINGVLYTTSFVDQQVAVGASYFYVIRAFDAAGNASPDSNVVLATPLDDQTPPQIRSLTPADNSAHNAIVELVATVSDNVGVTNVIFEYVAEPAGAYEVDELPWVLLQAGAESVCEWDVSELPTGRYLVRVTVEDAAGFSSTKIQTYLVDHQSPGSVGRINVQRRELALALAWSMPMDNDVVGFRLSRQADGGEFVVLKERYTSTMYVDSGLSSGVVYTYRVEAEDQLGQFSESVFSTPVATLEDGSDPVLVELSPAAYARCRGTVALAVLARDNDAIASGAFWCRASGAENWNDCGGEISFRWMPDSEAWMLSSSWDTDGLVDGEYEFLVRATDPSGNSLETTFALILDTEAPAAPVGLSVSDPQTGAAAALVWEANSEPDWVGYRVYRQSADGGSWEAVADTTATSFVDDSLTSDQSYLFAVSALDEAGNESALSEQASVAVTTRADLALQRIAFVPKNPTLERAGSIEAKVLNEGPARARMTVHFYATVDGVESEVGEKSSWINGQETLYVLCPWIPQSAGLTGIRAVAEPIAPAVDAALENNELSLETIVNRAPVALAGSDRSCDWYEELTFDASASSDPDGRIMEYVWDFGDGTTARGAVATHRYETIGVHTATLTVTDERNVSSSDSILISVADTRADLVVSAVNWNPGEPQEGDEITITATIQNVGNGPSQKEFFAAYYVDGVYNGYVIVDQLLAPGESCEAVVKWVATKGLHTVRIVADDLINSVNETNEANNDRQVQMTFQQIHYPDLQVSGLACPLPAEISSQMPLTVSVDLLNAGTADAENVFVALYRNGEMVARKALPDMIAGGVASTTFSLLPVEGENVLEAVVDGPISLVLESDETNNRRTLDLGDLSVSYPDLALSLQVLPDETELAYRSWIDMQTTIENCSAVDLQETAVVTFYADGIKVGVREIRYLAAGASETVAFQVPATDGAHELRTVVNEAKSIVESDFTNNEQCFTTDELTIQYSDLTIANIGWYTLDGESPAYGDGLIVHFDLSNLSLVSSYDQTAVVLLVDGRKVSSMEIGSIRGYDTLSAALKWDSVDVDPRVEHVISVEVDPSDLIPEEDEENNLAVAEMPFVPGDGLILEANVDHPEDDYFGLPLYISSENCRLTAKASRASAPTAWLDASAGRSMTVSLVYLPGPEIQQDGSVVYPDPEELYADEPMLYNPLTGEFNLEIVLEELQETGNYTVRVIYSDGVESVRRSIPFIVVQDCGFTMQVDPATVVAGEKIAIDGQVFDLEGSPLAGETVLLSIYQGSDGFGNTMNPVLAELAGAAEDVTLIEVLTGLDGSFSYQHRTLRGQSGSYTIKANVISSVVAAEAICNYEVLNAGFDGAGVSLTLPKNYSITESVPLQNSSDRALTGVRVELIEKSAAAGLDVRLISDVPSVLASGASVPLSLVLDADEQAGDAAEYELKFTCAEGIERSYLVQVTLKDSVPNICFDPDLVDVALNPGDSLFRSVTAVNQGLGTLKNMSVMGAPNLPWLQVANPGISALAPNEAVSLSLLIKPDSGTQLGIYRDYLVVQDEDGLSFKLPIQVELTSATRGGATFMVDNDVGQWVDQAEVRLISKTAYPVQNPDGSVAAYQNDVFILDTDEQGRVTFEDIPSGEYTYSIRCSGHDSAEGSVEIMPSSLPQVIAQTLTTTPITYEWTVTPVVIEDRYEVTLNIGMNLTGLLPPSIVSLPPWVTIAHDVQTGYSDRLIFKNMGDFRLYDVRVEVEGDPDLADQITLAGNGDIGTIEADETVQLGYFVKAGDYADVSGRFVLTGTYRMVTDSGELVEKELTHEISIYNPASQEVVVTIPTLGEKSVRLPDLNGGGGDFPKLPSAGLGDGANAAVRLEIAQEATLEREGFEAVLTFRNGLAEELVGFSVAPRVFDESGQDVTASFQLIPPSLSGALSATDGSENLPGSSEFTASWILVPGEGLGGEDPAGKVYYVEAAATYSQGGQLRNFLTDSETITVHPQPELELFYYLPEKILKNTPFRLGVFVENNGYGDARKFRIASAQPEVVENESGVPVEVEIVGSSFGAGNTETDTWTVELGDVAAQGWARGYWITRCNYDATVMEFTAELEHLPFEGVELNPLITAVHTEIILGDYLFADAQDPENSFSLIDRDDDGIPDYLMNLYSGFRSEITVPDELRVTQEPTIEAPQMVFSIADTYGFVCMVINDPLKEINIRGIQRHHLDGSGEVYELSGNNFWRDGDTLYVVDRIGEIVDGQEVVVPVEYEIDYESALEVRKIEIGTYVFNKLTADTLFGTDASQLGKAWWSRDLHGVEDFGVMEYGRMDEIMEEAIPLYDVEVPIIAGDDGAARVTFYNGGISPESGDVGIFLVDAEGVETPLATNHIVELLPYRTLEVELPFSTTTDGIYMLETRFLDGRTEGEVAKEVYVNARPVSDAGPDQIVARGESVRFDSSRSYDPDGLLVKYEWYMGNHDVDEHGKNTDGTWIAGPFPDFSFTNSGTYQVLLAVTDYYGAMEEDEMLITVEENRPDLYVESVSHGESMIVAGQTLTISVWVKNGGQPLTADGAFQVSLYAGNRLLETKTVVGGLASGESREITFTYVADAADDFLSVVVDDMGNSVNEANEGNNVDAVAIFAQSTEFADLSTENLRLSVASDETVAWGQSIQVLADIENLGSADAAKPFRVTAYVDGQYLGHARIEKLLTNASEAVSFDWVPTPGTHQIEVVADAPYSYIRERDEENNRANLTVDESNLDLRLPNVKLLRLGVEPEDGVLASGIPVAVTASFQNDSLVDLPFGSEAVLKVDGRVVARRSIGAIAAGKFSAVQLMWASPWGGEHTLVVELDPAQSWYETDRADNVLSETREFVFKEGDLNVRQFFIPGECQAGVKIPLGIQFANDGAGKINQGFTVRAFANGAPIAVARLDYLLNPGQTAWWSPVWIPSMEYAGTSVVLRVELDTLGEIAEPDSENNVREITAAVSQGMKTTLTLEDSVAVVGDSVAVRVELMDTESGALMDGSDASVLVNVLNEASGVEVARHVLTFNNGWQLELPSDGLAAGAYLLQAQSEIEGTTYVSEQVPLELVEERLVSCAAPDWVLLGDELTVTGAVALVDGTPEAGRTVAIEIQPLATNRSPFYLPATTDEAGRFAVSVQTDKQWAGKLLIQAQALGADLFGVRFASEQVSCLTAGLELTLEPREVSTVVGMATNATMTFEAIGADVFLSELRLWADPEHAGASNLVITLEEDAGLSDLYTNGQVWAFSSELWADAEISELPVNLEVQYELVSEAEIHTYTHATRLLFSAEVEKMIGIQCSDVRVYNGDLYEYSIPWNEDFRLLTPADRRLLIDVTVTNRSDQPLHDVVFGDPGYPWIEFPDREVGTLDPAGSKTIRIEIDTFEPESGWTVFPVDFDVTCEDGFGDHWPFELEMDSREPEELVLSCLLQDQYGNSLGGQQVLLTPVSVAGATRMLQADSEGVAHATLPAGRYQYAVQAGGAYPYRNREGELLVATDDPLDNLCYREITVTVDPFGLSLQKTESDDLETVGEARLKLVLEESDAPLKLSHPGREYLLLQYTDEYPAAFEELDPGYSMSELNNQLTIMNRTGGNLKNLCVEVEGDLADYMIIEGLHSYSLYLVENLSMNANHVLRWMFDRPALREARTLAGEDVVLDARLRFYTDEGFEALFYLRMRVAQFPESQNGVVYDYVDYTDWLGRRCPVGMETLPVWMGEAADSALDGTDEASLMAGISQKILAAGQSFVLENRIRNQLPDQSLWVENSGLRIVNESGTDVTERFAIEQQADLCGLEIEPLNTVVARWAVDVLDADLGGTLPGGQTYTALFEGATRYGSALIPYEQSVEFVIQPSPELQVNYAFEQTGARSGILTARVDNNGAGVARNVTLELPAMNNVVAGGVSVQQIGVIAPGDTAIFQWTLTFNRDIHSTEVLGQLQSFNPMMKGENGEWVKAPVTHEFRSEHTIEEVIAQVDDLMNALENKVEFEFDQLMFLYDDIGAQLDSIEDVKRLELMSYKMNSLVNATFGAIDVFSKAKSLVSDASGQVTKSVSSWLWGTYDSALQEAIGNALKGQAPTASSSINILSDKSQSGMISLEGSLVKLNAEIVNLVKIFNDLDDLHINTVKNFGKLYDHVLKDTDSVPTAEELRAELRYRSVDSAEFMRRMYAYADEYTTLPKDEETFDYLFEQSSGRTVEGLTEYIETVRSQGQQLKNELYVLQQSKVSAIFPVDQLYNELRSMTAALVTYDVSAYAQDTDYERKTVETPELEDADETGYVYWYAMGTSPANWTTPEMASTPFGAVQKQLGRSYDHLVWQWENISYHSELITKINCAWMQKFVFDSMGAGMGTMGLPSDPISPGVQAALSMEIDSYKLGIRVANDSEATVFDLLCEDVRDFASAHQDEAGWAWTFMRDFGGHLEYLIANRPIDPELSVQVLSFEINDAVVPSEGGMGFSTGVVSLKNDGELAWTGRPTLTLFADGLKVQELELPTVEMAAGEEGMIPLLLPLMDNQVYSLFGFDFELTMELWEEETLSRATCGPWMTFCQSGTQERLAQLSPLGTQRLLECSFTNDAAATQTYTVNEDGALRLMLMHNAAAMMDLYVFDEHGNMAGYDYLDEQVVCEIPEAEFAGVDSRCQIVTIRNVNAGSKWTIAVDGVDVETQDRMILTATELPDAPARFFTLNEEYRTQLSGSNVTISALLQEVSGTHGVENLSIETFSDPVSSNGVELVTELLVFALKDGAESLKAGGSVEVGVSVDIADEAEDGLYDMELIVSGNDAVTDEELFYSIHYSIELDRTAPDAPTLSIQSDTNNVDLIVASGTAEPGSTVEIRDDEGHVLASAKCDDDGYYSSWAFGLEYGAYQMVAVALDVVGNESEPSAPVSYTEASDWFAPVTELTLSGTRNYTGVLVESVTVTLSASDAGSGVDQTLFSLDGGETWQVYEGAFVLNELGAQSVEYYSTDVAGNREAVKYRSFWVTDAESSFCFSGWAEQITHSAERGAEDCPAGDGIPNLLKYAVGLDPQIAYTATELFTFAATSDGRFTVVYRKAKSAADVALEPVWIASLEGEEWDPVTQVEKLEEDDSVVIWQATLPDGTSGFFRLKASQ